MEPIGTQVVEYLEISLATLDNSTFFKTQIKKSVAF